MLVDLERVAMGKACNSEVLLKWLVQNSPGGEILNKHVLFQAICIEISHRAEKCFLGVFEVTAHIIYIYIYIYIYIVREERKIYIYINIYYIYIYIYIYI